MTSLEQQTQLLRVRSENLFTLHA